VTFSISPDFSQYMDIPWVEGDPEKGIPRFTCWTLFRQVCWDKLCIELPSYDEINPTNLKLVSRTIDPDVHHWSPISPGKERIMDGIMMYRGTHVGLVVRRGVMLHLERNCLSTIEPYTAPRWETCIDGFYRYGADPSS
jgi:hypothetical protein